LLVNSNFIFGRKLEYSNNVLLSLIREEAMMPLTMAKAGDTSFIKKIAGKDDVRRHLAELGFVVGESVTVVSEIGGNMILSVKDSRIALDKTLASRIMI
jgi:ferrous iron transport protein A